METRKASYLHKELWMWLAKNPSKEKTDWPMFERMTVGIYHSCFACHYGRCIVDDTTVNKCDVCPLTWPKKEICVLPLDYNKMNESNLFTMWYRTTRVKEGYANRVRSRLATTIANLPWDASKDFDVELKAKE